MNPTTRNADGSYTSSTGALFTVARALVGRSGTKTHAVRVFDGVAEQHPLCSTSHARVRSLANRPIDCDRCLAKLQEYAHLTLTLG